MFDLIVELMPTATVLLAPIDMILRVFGKLLSMILS